MAESWELSARDRRYSVPGPGSNFSAISASHTNNPDAKMAASEDLHAWSIYRQNLNSDFADSALGSNEKAPLPYGNFQLNSSTINSILSQTRYGPKTELAANSNAYLKFGLPRILPQSVKPPVDNSSGYDSSNDGSPVLASQKALSKSDPDFLRHMPIKHGANKWNQERRMKSSSEANLLSAGGASGFRQTPDISNPRPVSQLSKYSKVGSHISMQSRQHWGRRPGPNGPSVYPARDETMLNEKYFPRDKFLTSSDENDDVYQKHPHLQVRALSYEEVGSNGKVKKRILDNISVEARTGEILGILATTDEEGTAFLDVLANQHSRWGHRIRGDVVVNGVTIPPTGLANRIAYIQRNLDWSPDMSVRQTLLFTALLQAPGQSARNFDTRGRIDALIQDLGLGPVKHARVGTITLSERLRLNVACHLLLDTDIVLLDQPTKGMDIFDTFFLIEYLRQWATRGRIIVLTVHPPSYEIFTMLSRVALISSGRLMYFGRRREMLPYFAFIEFPCPAYKNPSDYYLDLVTQDVLTAEALLESSQRVQHLAETFRRRQEPLSDPGPPGTLPPRIRRANIILQLIALWIRALVFCFPANIRRWFGAFLTATIMSVAMGAIFWNVETHQPEQEDINDRIALHYVLGTVSIWPTLLLMISDVWREKDIVARDLKNNFYSRTAYFLAKTGYSFIADGLILLAYVVPAYAIAGIEQTDRGLETFGYKIGYMLLYLCAIRSMAMALSSLFPSRHMAAAASGLILSVVGLSSSFVVHIQSLGVWARWSRWLSPLYWLLDELKPLEFAHVSSAECSRNPVTRQETQGIVIKIPCGISSGRDALSYWSHNYDRLKEDYYPVLLILAFWLLFYFVHIIGFFGVRQFRKLSKFRRPRL